MTDSSNLMTTKGLRLDSLDRGDIVTVEVKSGDRSDDNVIFEVTATSASAAVCKVVWSGMPGITPVGTQKIFRHAQVTYHEASELLAALSASDPA